METDTVLPEILVIMAFTALIIVLALLQLSVPGWGSLNLGFEGIPVF